MATKAELLAEAYRRGLLPPDKATQYEEGVRRGLIRDDYAKGKSARGGLATFNAMIPGADELTAGITAAAKAATGRGTLKGNYKAERDFQEGQQAGLAQRNPFAANLTKGLSMAVQAVPFMASGGLTAAPRVVAPTLLGRAGQLGAAAGRNAVAGGAVSAATAFADKGTLKERAGAAADAVLPGMAAGAVLPALVATPGAVARSGAGRTVARAANKAVTAAGGKGFLNPQAEAFRVVGDALKSGGFTPQEIQQAQREWVRVGGPTPAFMDLIARDPRGAKAMSLFRGSAMTGAGKGEAVRYGNQTAVDLQDNAIARTAQLTPDRRTVPALRGEAETTIRRNAQAPEVQPGSGGVAVSGALNPRYDAARAQTNQAYDAVRQARPDQAMLQRPEAQNISASIREAVRDFDPRNVPRVANELSTLDNLSTPNLRDYFDARARLTALRSSADPVERAAAARATQALDGELERVVQGGSVTGDPSVLGMAQNAVASRRAQGQQFESGDLIGDLVGREYRGGRMTNVVQPEDASAAILGRNGVTPRPNQVADLTRLRDTLGADSPSWNLLRQEARARLLGKDAGSPEFGAAMTAFERQNPELAQLLTTPAERAALQGNRANIMGAQADLQAVDAGANILSPKPAEFAAELGSNTRLGANLNVAQTAGTRTLEDAIGRPTEGATGVLNRIGTATNTGRNLTALYGEQPAADYRQSVQQMVQQVQNARFIDPNSNSHTAGRIADTSLVEGVLSLPKTPLGWLAKAVEKVQRGATLSDAERQAIVQIATSKQGLPPELERVFMPQLSKPVPGNRISPFFAGATQGRQENR